LTVLLSASAPHPRARTRDQHVARPSAAPPPYRFPEPGDWEITARPTVAAIDLYCPRWTI